VDGCPTQAFFWLEWGFKCARMGSLEKYFWMEQCFWVEQRFSAASNSLADGGFRECVSTRIKKKICHPDQRESLP